VWDINSWKFSVGSFSNIRLLIGYQLVQLVRIEKRSRSMGVSIIQLIEAESNYTLPFAGELE